MIEYFWFKSNPVSVPDVHNVHTILVLLPGGGQIWHHATIECNIRGSWKVRGLAIGEGALVYYYPSFH